MSTATGPSISEVLPNEAWENLSTNQDAVMIDVRTKAEWGFVGIPDLSHLGKEVILLEWLQFPGMSPNADFVDALLARFKDDALPDMYFLCRSGARSMSAARAITAKVAADGGTVNCINIAEGFEGDLNAQRHRGAMNGWKAHSLPWTQS